MPSSGHYSFIVDSMYTERKVCVCGDSEWDISLFIALQIDLLLLFVETDFTSSLFHILLGKNITFFILLENDFLMYIVDIS